MNILFICKRYTQGRDLVHSPYGRFHFIPHFIKENTSTNVTIVYIDIHFTLHSFSSTNQYILRPSIGIKKDITNIVNRHKIELIVSFSDSWIGILASMVAKETQCKLLIDAYDNYESYTPYLTPLHLAWRNACKHADYLTASSEPLLNLMKNYANPHCTTQIIPMAADPNFKPLNLLHSRNELQIDSSVKIIGHFGSIDKHRNQSFLIKLADKINDRDDILILISGRKLDPKLSNHRKIKNLGFIDAEKLPLLINSCNVLLCLNRADSFGNFASPVKIYEALSCSRRILCTSTASVNWILNDQPDLLLDINEIENSIEKIICTLERPYFFSYPIKNWEDITTSFYNLISNN